MQTKRCETCNTEFQYKSAKAKYCSKYCNHLAYRHRNPDKLNSRRNAWYAKDKEARAEYRKRMRDYHREYWNKRRSTDLNFKIRNNLRNRLKSAIKNKSGSAIANLGCSIDFLISYLETKFKSGMSWNNHGEWHIDHVIPLKSFDLTNENELKKACHYTNLQPLWALDNLKKGDKHE